jgi:hypothetical protein
MTHIYYLLLAQVKKFEQSVILLLGATMEYIQNIKNPNICLSGGADGADLEWGKHAASIGHRVIHWSFLGHSTRASDDQRIQLNDEELMMGEVALENAARALGKSTPRRQTVTRLLRRNYYQVAWSNACYAVTFIQESDGQAPGGTVWATKMFSQLHPESRSLYVFDQNKNVWLQWNGESWDVIIRPPPPKGLWAGIGARALQQNGKDAIRELMEFATDQPLEEEPRLA